MHDPVHNHHIVPLLFLVLWLWACSPSLSSRALPITHEHPAWPTTSAPLALSDWLDANHYPGPEQALLVAIPPPKQLEGRWARAWAYELRARELEMAWFEKLETLHNVEDQGEHERAEAIRVELKVLEKRYRDMRWSGHMILRRIVDEDDPAADRALFTLGSYALDEGQYDAGQRLLTYLLWAHPSSEWAPYALLFLGDLELSQLAFSRAQTHFETLLQAQPDHDLAAYAGYKLGWIYAFDGRWEDSIAAFEEALSRTEQKSFRRELQSDIQWARVRMASSSSGSRP